MDRNLALEFVRVTEAAAIAAARWIGRGDKNAADGAAVDEMRARFNQIDFSARVVIGEGEKDEAPQLYTGEIVGRGKKPQFDLAIDPLERTRSVAYGRYNAMCVIATGPTGSLLHAPDTYMQKIAVGPTAAKVIDLNASVKTNIQKVAKALEKSVGDVTVVVLDRDRHKPLIKEIRDAGARVRLITDGDVAAAVATCMSDNPIDILMGIGGSTEAVLAAVPVKIMGGQLLCRFVPQFAAHTEVHKAKLKKAGIKNTDRVYTANDLAKGTQLTFTATGVIDGPLLSGVVSEKDHVITHSLVMRGVSQTLRYITTHHPLKPRK